MCIETKTGEDIKINSEEKDKLFNAVKLIEDFVSDAKAIHVMLEDHARRIDEEKEDREKDIKEIKTNYLDRFDDLKADIKDIRKDIRNVFIGIAIFFFSTITGYILAKISGLL